MLPLCAFYKAAISPTWQHTPLIALCIQPGVSYTGVLVKHLPHRAKLAFLRLVTYLRISAWGLEGNRKRGTARALKPPGPEAYIVCVRALSHTFFKNLILTSLLQMQRQCHEIPAHRRRQ